MYRIHWDVSDAKILIEVPVRRDVSAAILDTHFDKKLATLADCSDVNILVEDLDIRIGFDVSGSVDARLGTLQVDRFAFLAVELYRNLLQVENNIRRVFDYTRDRRRHVQTTFDSHRYCRC